MKYFEKGFSEILNFFITFPYAECFNVICWIWIYCYYILVVATFVTMFNGSRFKELLIACIVFLIPFVWLFGYVE